MRERGTSQADAIILGIEDLRPLPRATRIARTSLEGIQLLQEHRDGFTAFGGQPFQIGTVYVYSANPIGAETVVRALRRWSYHVGRTAV